MKKRRFLSFLLVIALFATLTCGAVPAFADGDEELSGHLVYWSMWNDTERQAQSIQAAADAFMEENPDVTIDIVFNGRDNKTIIGAAIDGGQQIDLFDLASVDYTQANFADYLLDLTDYFKQTYPTTDGKPFGEVILPAYIEILKNVTDDGRYYMVPYQLSAFMWMYNKDHFEQAGIEKAPETWDEFLDVCEKLKAAGFTPITSDTTYLDNNLGMHLTRLKGSDWVRDLVNDSSNEMWDDPAVLTALEDYQELLDKGYLAETIASNIYPAGQQEVALGDASMYWNGTWLVNEVMDVAGEEFNWGSFSYPTVDGQGNIYDVQLNAQGLCVSNKSENPDLAFAFIAYLLSSDWEVQLAESTYGVPEKIGDSFPSQLDEAMEYIEKTASRVVANTNIRSNSDKLAVIQDAFIRMLSGELTAEQALDAIKG